MGKMTDYVKASLEEAREWSKLAEAMYEKGVLDGIERVRAVDEVPQRYPDRDEDCPIRELARDNDRRCIDQACTIALDAFRKEK